MTATAQVGPLVPGQRERGVDCWRGRSARGAVGSRNPATAGWSRGGVPEDVDREGSQAISEGEGLLSGVEHVPGHEP
jgi:hypothetical protein